MGETTVLHAHGSHEHLSRCKSGQQAAVRVLIEWQAGLTPRRARSAEPPAPKTPADPAWWQDLAATLPPTAVPATRSGLRLALPHALDWREWRQPDIAVLGAGGDELSMLGDVSLWAALDDDVQWFDLHLSLHLSGSWYTPVLDSSVEGFDAAGIWRTALGLRADDLPALQAAGIEPAALRSALTLPSRCRWLQRNAGLGCFVAVAVDLGWTQTR